MKCNFRTSLGLAIFSGFHKAWLPTPMSETTTSIVSPIFSQATMIRVMRSFTGSAWKESPVRQYATVRFYPLLTPLIIKTSLCVTNKLLGRVPSASGRTGAPTNLPDELSNTSPGVSWISSSIHVAWCSCGSMRPISHGASFDKCMAYFNSRQSRVSSSSAGFNKHMALPIVR